MQADFEHESGRLRQRARTASEAMLLEALQDELVPISAGFPKEQQQTLDSMLANHHLHGTNVLQNDEAVSFPLPGGGDLMFHGSLLDGDWASAWAPGPHQ